MAKNPTRNKGKNMSSTNDALAALGLADEAPATATEAAAPAAEAPAESAAAEREEVEIGEIESGFLDFIPPSKRGGGSGSKYKFDELAAPAKDEATGKTKYAFHKVMLQDGVEELKLKRSVQSATTQANKQYKDEGKYFVTRTINEGGKFAGMYIIRTDAPPVDGGEDAE